MKVTAMKPLRNLRGLHGRARLIIVVAAIAVVLLLPRVPPPAAAPPDEVVRHDPDEMPIVAIRGAELATDEEALPAGALVRIGSTRFRHPVELSSSHNGGGRYLV